MAAAEQHGWLRQSVAISILGRRMRGILSLPEPATELVLFAQPSGCDRFRFRNQFAARALQEAGFATLLVDLLEEDEAKDRAKVFDIDLLASRVQATSHRLALDAQTSHLAQGFVGTSTGAAAALAAARNIPQRVRAIVSLGGRVDLARETLLTVTAPTLMIVGGNDQVMLDLNFQALDQLRCLKELQVIPGATHQFTEPGALEDVARLTTRWFQTFLQSGSPSRHPRVGASKPFDRIPLWELDPPALKEYRWRRG